MVRMKLAFDMLREAKVQDVGVDFVYGTGESVSGQIIATELAVAQLFWKVDIQNMRQDVDELCGIAESGTDGVGWVHVIQLWPLVSTLLLHPVVIS